MPSSVSAGKLMKHAFVPYDWHAYLRYLYYPLITVEPPAEFPPKISSRFIEDDLR
jgi:hypothetical protein